MELFRPLYISDLRHYRGPFSFDAAESVTTDNAYFVEVFDAKGSSIMSGHVPSDRVTEGTQLAMDIAALRWPGA